MAGVFENNLPGGLGGLAKPLETISPTLGTTPDPLVKTIIYVDPLILDLDGDGLEITPLSQGVLFDANGNSIKTGTAWAGADDGMLVWDRNGNGLIDSGRELFGDETVLANGTKAAHGFAALSELDVGSTVDGATVGAGDNVFDAKDAQFSNLRIWRDLNQDGVSQANELQTLAQTGITSIGLANTNPNTNYGDANTNKGKQRGQTPLHSSEHIMKTTTELKEFAQLAQASYAILNNLPIIYTDGHPGIRSTSDRLKSSPNGGFADLQATDFTNRYHVLNQSRRCIKT